MGPPAAPSMKRRSSLPLVPLLLGLLALLELRVELQLLAERFTFSALWFALSGHPLAVAVLAFTPWMLRRYR